MTQRDAMPGRPVETAVRQAVVEGQIFRTPAQGSAFSIAELDPEHLVLALGATEARTPITWQCLEGIPAFLLHRGWVVIRSRYDTSQQPKTLDGYVKHHLRRAAAAHVAVVLEHAGIVEVDRGRPVQVRLQPSLS